MEIPIIDLHCDLLFYLGNHPQRTPYDLEARCAIPQLQQSNVKIQTLAIFTQTDSYSVQKGFHQLQIYQELPLLFPKDIAHYSSQFQFESSLVSVLMAFENASGFCGEEESFQQGIHRLNHIIKNIAKPLYVSLTWNMENRFGGGALTQVGLKEDGKRLLEELHRKKIAVDLSHASDALAYEVIDYIEGHHLDIPLMASHSNARAITSVPRNLPNEIAKEIFRRGGVIGLNLYQFFVGETEDFLPKQIAHWLNLGGEEHIAFGADFFYGRDLPPTYQHGKEGFFPNYQNACCYGKLLEFLQKELKLGFSLLEKLAFRNALAHIRKLSC